MNGYVFQFNWRVHIDTPTCGIDNIDTWVKNWPIEFALGRLTSASAPKGEQSGWELIGTCEKEEATPTTISYLYYLTERFDSADEPVSHVFSFHFFKNTGAAIGLDALFADSRKAEKALSIMPARW